MATVRRVRGKRRIAAIVAVVWAALLVPLAILALADTPLNDAVGIVDAISTTILHLFQSPQNDTATVGDAVTTTYLPLLHSSNPDSATIGDAIATHIFYLLHQPSADSASITDQVSISFVVRSTSTGLQSSANPSTYGSPVTLTATITSSSPNPSNGDGTVTFKDGTTTLCSDQPLNGNQATCATSLLAAGAHTVTANYSGSSRYGPSSGSLSQQVNPAPLTVTANNASRLYGAPNPASSVSYSGLVNNDTTASLTGTLSFSTAPLSSGVGTYPITPSGLSSPNYTITFVNGTLTITPAPLTITANDATRMYGAPNPAFSVSYAGLVNGDASTVLNGTLSYATAPLNSGVGSYPITPSGPSSPNYSITYAGGTLTITAAPLAVTANDATKYYGQPNPAFSLSVSGLVNGDTQSVLGTPTFSTPATQTSDVGTYPVAPSNLSDPNYSYSYGNGTLTIKPAPTATALTATPNPAIVHRPVSLKATVTTTASNGINPSSIGAVSFYFGSTLLGSQPIDASGVATLSVSALPVGHDTLTGVYADPANYLGSTSPAVVEQVLQNRIAFSSNRDGNLEIYIMNPDGSGQTRLTTNAAIDTNPAVSPDGTKIAFVSTRSGRAQIWVMNADGSNPRQLTADPGFLAATPAWSPDGKKIAYTSTRSGAVQIWVVATDGTYPNTAPTQLTANSFALADTTPAWSPDGTTIAFTSTHSGLLQIWTMSANGTGTPNQLTSNSLASVNAAPVWSPDGTQIAFVSNKPGLPAVYLMSASGANPTRLTNDGLALDAAPTWSTDGKQVAFTTTIGGVVEIYVINADGTGLTKLTSGPAVNALPSWSTPLAQ